MVFAGLCMLILPTKASISINVGDTYTCSLGYISNFKSSTWTSSDYQCLDFVGTVSNYSTQVTVKALAKPSYATPVTIHCQYDYYDLDPTTGRYTYLRTGYMDFQFFISDNGAGSTVYVTEINLNYYSLDLNVGEGRQLSATVYPNNATDKSVTWSSSKPSVATVSSNGWVTAKSSGRTNIFCQANDGSGVYKICSIDVSGDITNYCVVVEMKSGERMEYLLSSSPIITPKDGETIRITTTNTSIDLQIEKIVKIYLSSSTDIKETKIPDGRISRNKECIEFSDFGAFENVILYNTDGRLLMRRQTNSSGHLSLSLQDLPNGIYVIKTKHQSIKITRK